MKTLIGLALFFSSFTVSANPMVQYGMNFPSHLDNFRSALLKLDSSGRVDVEMYTGGLVGSPLRLTETRSQQLSEVMFDNIARHVQIAVQAELTTTHLDYPCMGGDIGTPNDLLVPTSYIDRSFSGPLKIVWSNGCWDRNQNMVEPSEQNTRDTISELKGILAALLMQIADPPVL